MILSEVDLSARFGEVVGLVGPNGAGKTTLLRAIGGLIKADRGEVLLDGRQLRRLSARAVARITAHLPQDHVPPFRFNGIETVLLGRTPHLGPFSFEGTSDAEVALTSMDRTGTTEFAQRFVAELSGGERQRVAMARTLTQQPKILLLDEPTANLDIGHRHELMTLVRELASEGVATVAAMHDLELAAEYCDRLVLLHDGVVIGQGTAENVLLSGAIADVYGVRIVCGTNPVTGKLKVEVLPARLSENRGAHTVHVIAGGGAGASIMRALREGGFRVTACPLSPNDSDAQAAQGLGIEFPAKRPFTRPSQEQRDAHRQLVSTADVVVVAPTPFGEGNLDNLRAIEGHPAVVILDAESLMDRDFTSGEAISLIKRLGSRKFEAGHGEGVEVVRGIVGASDQSSRMD